MVYLIHFDSPFKHAKHYIGFTETNDVTKRMDHHRKGSGSSLMKAVTKAGISWNVVRTWPNETRTFERKLKNRKKSSQICPVCNKNIK